MGEVYLIVIVCLAQAWLADFSSFCYEKYVFANHTWHAS